MKKSIIVFLMIGFLFSCTEVSIKDVNTEFVCTKTFNKVDLTSKYYNDYTPNVHTVANFNTNYKFVNRSGQIFENYSIVNHIELIFDNDFVRHLNLSEYNSDSVLNHNSSIMLQQSNLLNEIDSFDLKLLMHDVKKANLVFKIHATNSIGLNLGKEVGEIVKIDITDKWREIEIFNKESTYKNFTHFKNNYMEQMVEAIFVYEYWKKALDENIYVVFGFIDSLDFVRGRSTYFYQRNFETWIKMTEDYNLYFEYLLESFFEDLIKNDFNINDEFAINWIDWILSVKQFMKSDLETLTLVKDYFHEIQNRLQNHIPSDINSRRKIIGDFNSDYASKFHLPDRGYYNRRHSNYGNKVINDLIQENSNYLNHKQDSAWNRISKSINMNRAFYSNAMNLFDKSMSSLEDLNK